MFITNVLTIFIATLINYTSVLAFVKVNYKQRKIVVVFFIFSPFVLEIFLYSLPNFPFEPFTQQSIPTEGKLESMTQFQPSCDK